LHIGGEPGPDINTSYILRGAKGQAYYPGTAFKGKVRHYALQLQKEQCIFAKNKTENETTLEVCDCAVCRMFGGEGNAPGSLFFSDFHAVGEHGADLRDADLRVGNTIDRFRRVAEDEKLFTTESAAIQVLEGYITGYVSQKDADEDVLLKNSIKLIKQIGGNTSRGFGWIDGEIEVEDQPPDHYEQNSTASNSGSVSCVRVSLTPKSPLLIGTHTTQSNFRDTQCIIPGAVIRAALARAICIQDGTRDPSTAGIKNDLPKDRDTLFKKLRESFSSLRISTLQTTEQPEPYPITTRKCKFDGSHIYTDILAALIINERLAVPEILQCPECGGEPGKGRLEKVKPYKRIQKYLTDTKDSRDRRLIASIHSEIDKLLGTAKDGRLFTVRAIAPEAVTYHGTISGNIDFGELSLLLRSPLRVGAMLTSGFGVCKVEVEEISEKADDAIKSRIEKFNIFLKDQIKRFDLIAEKGYLVPITLLSDAIVDLDGPSDGDFIKAYEPLVNTDPKEPAFEMVRVITKPQMWRGFDTSKRRGDFEKKPRFLLQAGSVLVVRVDNLGDSTIDKLLLYECEGIGYETKDGYGAVRVAHENHFNENALTMKGGQRND
jgi:CRISPR/Cas system CSM-associated protein Csm3 (group 7 of RAMP superfamily)